MGRHFELCCHLGGGISVSQTHLVKLYIICRHLEQLVLYVRSLHLLSSSLQLARKEIKDERLQISNSLKQGELTYMYCKRGNLRVGLIFAFFCAFVFFIKNTPMRKYNPYNFMKEIVVVS